MEVRISLFWNNCTWTVRFSRILLGTRILVSRPVDKLRTEALMCALRLPPWLLLLSGWLVHRARRLITIIANVVQVALCLRRFTPTTATHCPSPFQCGVCGFLKSFVLDPQACKLWLFQESDIDSSAFFFCGVWHRLARRSSCCDGARFFELVSLRLRGHLVL